jgi:hypothetical protein
MPNADLSSRSVIRNSLVGALFAPLAAFVGMTLVAGCSKPDPLDGTYSATCNFKGNYRGGGRPDSAWTRTCTLTLEARSESEVGMRFDTGDAMECYGHAAITGGPRERKMVFAKNDLTCRAKTLPAPAGVAVEQCPMPATFEITELPADKSKKIQLATKVSLEVGDKRACVMSYLDRVSLEGKLSPGGKPVELEVFKQDAGANDLPPPPGHGDAGLPVPPPRPAQDASVQDAGSPVDASAKDAPKK